MKTKLLVISLVPLLLGTRSTPAPAQPPKPTSQSPATVVALLDMAKVIKSHPHFKYRIGEVKREIESYENQIHRQRESLGKLSKDLQQHSSGSSEYRRIEAQLARSTSEIQIRTRLKRNDILSREARIYYETYVDLLSIVRRIAEHHGISVVLRFDSQPIEPTDRGTILRGVNRNVVFQSDVDLTHLVLRQLAAQ